ncbi:hypothetical protein [Amycolatopsis panacis]|uniref:Uncharacterized protein n=1 Tax=Amycolatopsis panacis TaxID=2340917 RepID=A0A419I900_9PSEU|nr:hypothetical protein [Amycolatopsis panacis]RJQ88531.1 hypothetical protein D5S19_06080 [Amycolatopsis panacis]
MRPRWTVLAALATGIGVGLAGCGQPPAPAQPHAGGQSDPASRADPAAGWADGYCTAVSHLVRTLAGLPEIDPSSPLQAARTASRLLSSVAGGIDRTIAGLGQVGPPPLSGGEAARAELLGELASVGARADDVRRRLDVAVGADATRSALGEARSAIDAVSRLDVLKGLDATPELTAAGKRASGCQQLVVPPAPS